MAQSLRRARPFSPSAALKELISDSPVNALKSLAIVVLGLAAGLGLWLSPSARDWAFKALGYGWIPAGAWIAASLAALRYRPRSIVIRWRWWLMGASIAAAAIALLSLVSPSGGPLAEVSLGGRWGSAIAGGTVVQTVGMVAVVNALLPLILFPRRVGRAYLRLLRYLALGVQGGAIYLYLGLHHGIHFLDRGLRSAFSSPLPGHWAARAWFMVLWLWRPGLLRRSSAPAEPEPAADAATEPEGAVSLWAKTDPGVIPSWAGEEAAGPLPAAAPAPIAKNGASEWKLPPIDLLTTGESRSDANGPLEQMARHIEGTLADHGVSVEVGDIKAGPRIVRFGLVPGWLAKKGDSGKEDQEEAKGERSRVKVQSILMREKDLALALQTPYLRIEAPVPGEALVGLEVPSPTPSKVHLREVIEAASFGSLAAKGALPIAIGQDTGGAAVSVDLSTLPHMLIAGATGAGKSVCINSIIATLLLTKPPDQLRLLLVDPKRVELTPFNGVPHLITPVIVDNDQVNIALQGLMREMLRRYKSMEEVGARNISSYNSKAAERLPYLVLIVDELADLMIAGGFEVEQNLVRLAQLGRATGIHLVLATQRPSVNVVTGLLKANVPARIAFAVASQIDSRVILDAVGAEKLLGKGDMLLLHNDSPKPRRVQGTLVYDEEIDKIVDFWTNQKGPPLPEIPMGDAGGPEEGEEDEEVDQKLMEQARDMALGNPRISPSYLERRLKIGGWRATQIMGILEDEGLVVSR